MARYAKDESYTDNVVSIVLLSLVLLGVYLTYQERKAIKALIGG